MNWLFLIIVCAFLFAVVDIIDKFFCGHKIKSVYTLSVLTGSISVIITSSLLFFVNFKFSWGWPVFFACLSAVFYFFLWLFWWQALKTTEVSRSTAIYNSSPIYTALMAVIFLGETLSIIKWLAIIMIVVGTILCSYEKTNDKKVSRFNIMYLLVILAALCNSLGSIVSKIAVGSINPFVANLIAVYAGAPLFLTLLLKKEVSQELVASVKNVKIIIPFIIRGLIAFIAVICFYLAMKSGPASLVAAGYGTNPLFVFGISVMISRFFPKIIKENITPVVLSQKALAIILIVGGVVLINF